jgi:hypothetical protein
MGKHIRYHITLLLLALSTQAIAQETVNYISESELNGGIVSPIKPRPDDYVTMLYPRNYYYDSAGNRISRTPLMASSYEPIDTLIHFFKVDVGDKQVTIKSSGNNFEVDMNTWDDSDHGNISVFTTGGQKVKGEKIESVSTDVDLNSQPNGIYLISVAVNEDRKTVAVTNK